MNPEKLTSKFKSALNDAQSLALAKDHQFIEGIHLLSAMLEQQGGGESLLLRKLILGIQAQVRSKSLTGLIKICDALIRPASTYKNPRGVFI